jgi:hypothetical protein
MSPFDLITGLASVAGFIFSLLAFIQARKASLAAKEAREAVLIRNLAEEFQTASGKMDELLDLIAHSRYPEAIRVTRELRSALSEMTQRRAPYLNLSLDKRNELLDVRTQAEIIEEQILSSKNQALVGW